MNRLFGVVTLAALTGLALGGCTKSENAETPDANAVASASSSATAPQPGMSYTPPMAMPTPSGEAAASAGPGEEPPNEQKATQKAAREITKANYKSELNKMEKEIGATR